MIYINLDNTFVSTEVLEILKYTSCGTLYLFWNVFLCYLPNFFSNFYSYFTLKPFELYKKQDLESF